MESEFHLRDDDIHMIGKKKNGIEKCSSSGENERKCSSLAHNKSEMSVRHSGGDIRLSSWGFNS